MFGFGTSSQPAFGGAFGQSTAAAQPSGFGSGAFGSSGPGGFGLASFGSGQPAVPGAFGAPQQPPGPMIPNPFGGGMSQPGFAAGSGGGGGVSQGGGAFSMGSVGNSQSEGRRKVRVRRPR